MNLTAEQLIALATTTALNLAKDTKNSDILILADFFSLIGTILTLISDKKDSEN